MCDRKKLPLSHESDSSHPNLNKSPWAFAIPTLFNLYNYLRIYETYSYHGLPLLDEPLSVAVTVDELVPQLRV